MRPDPARIINLANAYFDSCLLFAASDLGIFGELAALGQADSHTVAAALGLNERGVKLLLDACVATGLVAKQNGWYRNASETEVFLVPGRPADLSDAIRYNRDVYPAWHRLADFVRTGVPVERPELHLGEDADRTRTFVLSMHARALALGQAVVPQLSLAGRKRLLDVGGGPATYSVLIAEANPEIECLVLDLPPIVTIAAELIAQQGKTDRVRTLAGDYHTVAFPPGNDAVILFGMMHQESPDSILDLLRRAYASLVPGGVVYVMDMMTDGTHTAPKFSAIFAVNMALTTRNGWVFSDVELKHWMEQAGFEEVCVKPLPPPMPHWLACARRPDA
jgi:SAM-dependent methyltransferase